MAYSEMNALPFVETISSRIPPSRYGGLIGSAVGDTGTNITPQETEVLV
jgi:hypothetical protein